MMRSKNVLARKILCGLLAAGVVGACGSALAAEYTGKITSGTYTDDSFNMTTDGEAYPIDPSSTVNILSQTININSTMSADANLWVVEAWGNNAKVVLGGENTDSIKITAKNTLDNISRSSQVLGIYASKGSIDVRTKDLLVDVSGPSSSPNIVAVESNNGGKVTINAENITINSTIAGIASFSNAQMDINGNLTVNARDVVDVRGESNVNINTDGKYRTILNGDIVFETPNTKDNAYDSGEKINANVNINLNGTESSWTGKAYQHYDDTDSVDLNAPTYYGNVTGFKMTISDGATWNMTGDSFINDVTVADGGAINIQEGASLANLQKVTLDNGIINLQGENQKVNIIDEVSGEGTVATNSLTNNVSLTSAAANGGAAITVQGTGAIGDAIAADSSNAQKLANVVSTGEGEDVKSAATKITTAEGKVAGAYTADVKDGAVVMSTLQGTENTTNRAISDMASISLMTWRQENNDMNKRLGELRDSKGEHGAWARMARGESKYGAQNVKNQYNYYQVGYDEKLSVNPNWTVGVALTRTEGTSTFTNGSGENKHTGFAVYGSYLKDDGSFIDLIAKYARMDNDYKTVTGAGSGDYETNGYSLSAEYGKRFTKANGLWIEPQVELTYGRVGSADYVTANGVKVRQDEMNSIVGRLGFSLGKDIKQGNVYLRASYLYDFDGETDVKMVDTASGAPASYKQDLGGGWWEVGVGTNLNLSDATHLYFDIEKTYGGNVATPWQWNAGVRWSF